MFNVISGVYVCFPPVMLGLLPNTENRKIEIKIEPTCLRFLSPARLFSVDGARLSPSEKIRRMEIAWRRSSLLHWYIYPPLVTKC